MDRPRCLRSLLAQMGGRERLVEAQELEHALFCNSDRDPLRYPLLVLHALRLLEAGCLPAEPGGSHEGAAASSYRQLLLLPPAKLGAKLPCLERIVQQEEKVAAAQAFLRDLSSPDTSSAVPNAGTRCARCGSTDITFDFLQTRSADEGTTVYCTCDKCAKRWKM